MSPNVYSEQGDLGSTVVSLHSSRSVGVTTRSPRSTPSSYRDIAQTFTSVASSAGERLSCNGVDASYPKAAATKLGKVPGQFKMVSCFHDRRRPNDFESFVEGKE